MTPFGGYARYYDLLYRDKDYAGEAAYVGRTVRLAVPEARRILELGSGTGRHGRLLAAMGFDVHGIERSPEMAALAQSAAVPPDAAGSFSCEVGDARTIALDRNFAAVVALFHVVSYQTMDDDLQATFATAARHLAPGGVFLFDVWHGPAVLTQRPEARVKKAGDGNLEVIRTARPELDAERHTVKVTYEMECRDLKSGEIARFAEDHLVRYLFPAEIESFGARSGMQVVRSEEFMSGWPPSPDTWSVAYVLRKSAL